MSRLRLLLTAPAAVAVLAIAGTPVASAQGHDVIVKNSASTMLTSPASPTAHIASKVRKTRKVSKTLKTTTTVSLSALQQGVVDCANSERAKVGLPALVVDPALTRSAQGHAADMDANHYFDHNSKNGRSPWERITAALNGAKPFSLEGENIAMGFDDAATTCAGWMNSAPHKANILNKNFTSIGAGWADGYAVQDFGSRR